MLSHFSVKNYKCLADVSLPLTPIHVLIGQNDTGKTSLFEAIQAGAKLAVAPNLAQSAAKLFDYQYPQELVWFGSKSDSIAFDLVVQPANRQDPAVPFSIRLNLNPQGVAHKRNPVAQAIPSLAVQIVRFRPKMMARPSASNQIPEYSLEADGFGLSTLLDEITGHDVDRYVQLQAKFREFFPKYSRVMLTPTQAWKRQKQDIQDVFHPAIGKEIRLATREGEIRLSQASDGAILLLGFLALTYSPSPPDILLIEEPENGIYPPRLIEIAKLLRQFVEREENAPQIIMTTHSPYLLSQFKPEEVTLMRRQPDGSAKAFPLRNAKHIQERMGNEFYLGELWYNLDEEELIK